MKNNIDFIEISYKIKVRKLLSKFIYDKENTLYFIGNFFGISHTYLL